VSGLTDNESIALTFD